MEAIKALLNQDQVDEAIEKLEALVEKEPQNEEAFILLGHAYRKKENWQQALNNYAQALEINPNSVAKPAYDMILQILEFFNKDLYNQ